MCTTTLQEEDRNGVESSHDELLHDSPRAPVEPDTQMKSNTMIGLKQTTGLFPPSGFIVHEEVFVKNACKLISKSVWFGKLTEKKIATFHWCIFGSFYLVAFLAKKKNNNLPPKGNHTCMVIGASVCLSVCLLV